MQYNLELPLWEEIDVERSSNSYQAVGKQHFTLAKKRAPGRWKQLYAETTNKPINYRLWLQHHEQHVVSLWEYEGDSVTKFEGHQWMEDQEEYYLE